LGGVEYLAQRFNRPFDPFFDPRGTCLAKKKLFFHHFTEIQISLGSAEKIIKIQPTAAELSAKNHFPIFNTNP